MTPRTYGLLVTGQTAAAPTPPDLRAVLASVGIVPVGEIRECKDVRKRPGAQPSWCVELPQGARIPPEVWAQLQPGAWRSGNLYVVQMKGS